MDGTARTEILRSLEQREVSLVRALVRNPDLLDARGETSLRTALSLARLYRIKGPEGEVDVEEVVAPFRDEVLKLCQVAGVKENGANAPSAEKLRPIATILRAQALRAQQLVYRRCAGKLQREAVDREIRSKGLVLVCGGGGGAGYIYLGAFKLLEECALRPALLAGTSMGAIASLFRARALRFDSAEALTVVRSLAWSKLFHLLSMESRYGLPAALRLYLRASIGRYFEREDGAPLQLRELPIPLLVTVSGIRAGVLPRPLEFYERLLGGIMGDPSPYQIARRVPKIVAALMELLQVSERLEKIYLGLDAGTESFDAIDAIGFSSALPGVVHYDIVRKDDRMHGLLGGLFRARSLFRLSDGGLVDNVPASAAWRAVHRGLIGTRNAFIVAFDCFAPKLMTPVWLGLQGLVAAQVQASCRWAHVYKGFKGGLSPIEVVPGIPAMIKMLERGKAELASELPFIQRMMKPLPAL